MQPSANESGWLVVGSGKGAQDADRGRAILGADMIPDVQHVRVGLFGVHVQDASWRRPKGIGELAEPLRGQRALLVLKSEMTDLVVPALSASSSCESLDFSRHCLR
jgi:hypothetical protein